VAPRSVQVRGVQPHTFGVPAPPQVAGSVHEPQLRFVPQPLATVPQFLPAQLPVGVQQLLVSDRQTAPPAHCPLFGPQVMVLPHPSGYEPQLAPRLLHVAGVQPHTSGVPEPPQVWGNVQVPQLTVPPHPSGAVPQFLPAHALGFGVQHDLVSERHMAPPVHWPLLGPHWIVLPHPSE
jgi:hypothetical protein